MSNSTTKKSIMCALLAATTAIADPVVHVIKVGKGDHSFSPEITNAKIGDKIVFEFYPTNHSVVRSDAKHPCIPYELIRPNTNSSSSIFSGFRPVNKILPNPPTFNITIDHLYPIFFYCSAPGSCINFGMVGVINPSDNETFHRHKEAARKTKFMLQPNETWPSEELGGPGSTSSATGRPEDSPLDPKYVAVVNHGMAPAAVAGITIGSVALLAMIGGLFFFMGRFRTKKLETTPQPSPPPTSPPPPPFAHVGYDTHGVYVPDDKLKVPWRDSAVNPYPHGWRDSRTPQQSSPVEIGSPVDWCEPIEIGSPVDNHV